MKILPVVIFAMAFAGVIAGSNKRSTYEIPQSSTTADSITVALEYQMRNYPASQYRDVYKNFMQDYFGPGHLLSDTAASGRYLRKELSEGAPFEGPLYEPTGFRGNFIRVNIGLIADGTIPYDVFFSTFVESMNGITPPDGKDWMETWKQIDSVITAGGLSFFNEEEDRLALEGQFSQGNYIVHHSQRYNDSVRFHYRIISTPLFRERLLPLIKR